MADCPKCPTCKDKGLDSNTYKMAGKPMVKCGTCKNLFSLGMFEDFAFNWKAQEVKELAK